MLTMPSTPASFAAWAKVRRRLQDAGADGIDEVGPLDAVERSPHLAEVEKVAEDDLDPAILELL